MTWDDYAETWSGLHGGFDPRRAAPVVRGWIRGAYRIGGFLARIGATPFTVTVAGLLLCLLVPLAVLLGPPGFALGSVLVLLASAADGLDGAVAVLTSKITKAGFVYDSVADRLGEAAWLTAFWLAGAPGWLVVSAGAASWLHEYVRARAAAAGMPDIGVVTVGERPTRVSVSIVALVGATILGPAVLTAGAAVWLLLQLIGLAQLTVAVRTGLHRLDG